MNAARVTILGATGSVGRSTLDLIERNRERFEVVALTAHRDVAGLAELARGFGARLAVIGDERLLGALEDALAGTGIEAAAGEAAVVEAARVGRRLDDGGDRRQRRARAGDGARSRAAARSRSPTRRRWSRPAR